MPEGPMRHRWCQLLATESQGLWPTPVAYTYSSPQPRFHVDFDHVDSQVFHGNHRVFGDG